MIPYVPFVERKHHRFAGTLFELYMVADGDHAGNEVFHVGSRCKEGAEVAVIVFVIAVKRNVIHIIICLTQDLGVPFRERRHGAGGASAEDKFYFRVCHLHHRCGIRGKPAVFMRGLVSDLPLAVHFVSEAPRLYSVRLVLTVCTAHIGIFRACRCVAVFDKVLCVLRAACAEIDRHKR